MKTSDRRGQISPAASGMRAAGAVPRSRHQIADHRRRLVHPHLRTDCDGLLLEHASFLSNELPQDDFTLDGEPISFKADGPFRVYAAAAGMRQLRQMVGRGFLIGESSAPATLLGSLEMDLQVPADLGRSQPNHDDFFERDRCSAGAAPIVQAMTPEQLAATVIHADTPIVRWPPQGKSHDAWWTRAGAARQRISHRVRSAAG